MFFLYSTGGKFCETRIDARLEDMARAILTTGLGDIGFNNRTTDDACVKV